MLYGAAAARELGLLDDTRIVLHFVCDEETGSAVGSGHLRDAGLIDPERGRDAHRRADRRRRLERLPRRDHAARRRARAARPTSATRNTGVNAFEHMVRVAAAADRRSPHELFERATRC